MGLIPENGLADMLGCESDPATGGPKVDGSFQTSVPGAFSCGNSLHIHDLADWASAEGDAAGAAAATWTLETDVDAGSRMGVVADGVVDGVGTDGSARLNAAAGERSNDTPRPGSPRLIPVVAGAGVGHVVPQRLVADTSDVRFEFRVSSVVRDAAFEAVGIRADGEDVLAHGRARIAVPAEMARLRLRGADVSRYDSIEVRAHVR